MSCLLQKLMCNKDLVMVMLIVMCRKDMVMGELVNHGKGHEAIRRFLRSSQTVMRLTMRE